MNDFEFWIADLDKTKTTETEALEIAMGSEDPIDCAIQLQLSAEIHNEQDGETIRRIGLSALSSKYYAQYLDRVPLEILTNSGYALPEPSHYIRKRFVDTPMTLPEHSFIRGSLSLIAEYSFTNQTTGKNQSLIALRMREPYLLDDFSNPRAEIELPDYVITPVTSIIRYAFMRNEIADNE